jgi:hypothetical protein
VSAKAVAEKNLQVQKNQNDLGGHMNVRIVLVL